MSSQVLYNEFPQYPQSLYMGANIGGPRPQSQMYYNNYYNRVPQQHVRQQPMSTPEPPDPQFIYATHPGSDRETASGQNKISQSDVIGFAEGL